jgi:hypothetical protein
VSDGEDAARAETLDQRLRVLPAGTALPPEMREEIASLLQCGFGETGCSLVFLEGRQEAVLLQDDCYAPPEPKPAPTPGAGGKAAGRKEYACYGEVIRRFLFDNGKWIDADDRQRPAMGDDVRTARAAGYRAGQVEVRKVERRQIFVGGQPVGDVFE